MPRIWPPKSCHLNLGHDLGQDRAQDCFAGLCHALARGINEHRLRHCNDDIIDSRFVPFSNHSYCVVSFYDETAMLIGLMTS